MVDLNEAKIKTDKNKENDLPMEFLVFNMGQENYAIEIHKVLEIKHYSGIKITAIMNSPVYLLGITNLHDHIIPIIDLRILYHLEQKAYGESAIVIILDILPQRFGIVVDGVSQIVQLKTEQINQAAEVKSIIGKNFLHGIATSDDLLLIVLDIEKLITSSNLGVELHGNA